MSATKQHYLAFLCKATRDASCNLTRHTYNQDSVTFPLPSTTSTHPKTRSTGAAVPTPPAHQGQGTSEGTEHPQMPPPSLGQEAAPLALCQAEQNPCYLPAPPRQLQAAQRCQRRPGGLTARPWLPVSCLPPRRCPALLPSAPRQPHEAHGDPGQVPVPRSAPAASRQEASSGPRPPAGRPAEHPALLLARPRPPPGAPRGRGHGGGRALAALTRPRRAWSLRARLRRRREDGRGGRGRAALHRPVLALGGGPP